MEKLVLDLIDKRSLSISTAEMYVRNLRILNGSEFKSVSFLRDLDAIKAKLDEMSAGTRRNYLVSIVSVLSLMSSVIYSNLRKTYVEMMNASNAEYDGAKPAVGEKTEKQQQNWITFEEVMKHLNTLAEKVKEMADKKTITSSQFETLLSAMVLSLYALQPPRRNKDYSEMWIVPQMTDDLPKDKNYIDLNTERFIFNQYKTTKTYGEQTISYSENPQLKAILNTYLRFHPNMPKRTAKSKPAPFEVRFLVSSNGTELTATNAITRILNRIFKKKIGSSMLRHIYLSDKFADTMSEMKETASAMGHSISVAQNEYIKSDDK
jgi:hypothetical protein